MSILSVQDISKSYKLRKVVKSLSLEIKSGEVVGLLGPNGAGKTTAFYMIVGLIAADKGTILLDGKDLTAQPMHRRAKLGLGYLPQEVSIFRKLTVEQNILAILELREDLDLAGREFRLTAPHPQPPGCPTAGRSASSHGFTRPTSSRSTRGTPCPSRSRSAGKLVT